MITQKQKQMIREFIMHDEGNILRCDVSYRGGGCEWDITSLVNDIIGTDLDLIKCACYQNYLGGGMAGSIQFSGIADQYSDAIDFSGSKKKIAFYDEVKKTCIEYFYNLNNGGGDEYMQEEVNTLENVQRLPASGS